MSDRQASPRRIAVIGGGLSGLAAVHRLVELDPSCRVSLLEAESRLGGVLSTVHHEGFQVEQSADNFITTIPWGVDLCKRLGLADQLIQTNPAHRQTYVVRRGRLHKLPDGFLMMAPTRWWPLVVTPILSPLGKLRAALEYVIPPRKDQSDESMAAFVCRRLGHEAFERLVEPLISAVYAADMEKLSIEATLPRFREMEREHGSLIRAMRHQMKTRPKGKTESGPRYSMFVTLHDGLSSMVEAIAGRLPSDAVRLNTPVERIERHSDGWRLWVSTPSPIRPHPGPLPEGEGASAAEQFNAVIVATPSGTAARLLRPIDGELAGRLAGIEHSGTAVVSLGYDREQIGHPLDGMGVVVPAVENSPILACSFSSQKYAHRSPEGKALLRVFVGGARRPELAEMDDQKLRPLVLEDLARLLSIRGRPGYCNIAHWPGTMPQYYVGHNGLVDQIEARLAGIANLELAGNAYHGVGIPACVHSGEQAAERILAACGLNRSS